MPGWQEILVIIVVLMILFYGGRKIPEIARGLGKGMSEFKRGMQEPDEEEGEGEDASASSSPDKNAGKADIHKKTDQNSAGNKDSRKR